MHSHTIQYDKTLCVVLLPASNCAINLATADVGWLTGILDLKSRDEVSIVKQSDTLLCLRCCDFSVKQRILSWDTRQYAEEKFAIRVKEDLWKHERAQKAKLWPVMEALYKAGLRPTWSRASVTWKTSQGRFFIHPGQLPESLPAADIVSYARSGCNAPATTQSNAPMMIDSESQTESRHVPAETSNPRLITTLQQDLALAKQRIAAQSIQCCYWRQRYKAYEAKVGPPKLSRHASSQTSGITLSAHVCVQTDTPPAQQGAEDTPLAIVPVQDATLETTEFPLPGGPTLTVPKCAMDAIQEVQDWCLQQGHAKAKELTTKYEGELQTLCENMKRMGERLAEMEGALAKYNKLSTKLRKK